MASPGLISRTIVLAIPLTLAAMLSGPVPARANEPAPPSRLAKPGDAAPPENNKRGPAEVPGQRVVDPSQSSGVTYRPVYAGDKAVDPAKRAAAGPAPTAIEVTPEQIAALIQRLDHDEFSQREAASRRLLDAGAAAVPGLQQAAVGASLEASMRAFAVLRKFASTPSGSLQTAAFGALGTIAAQRDAARQKGDERLAAAAARARDVIDQVQRDNPPTDLNVAIVSSAPQIVVGGGLQLQGRVQIHGINIQQGELKVAGGDNTTSISVSVVDNTRTVEVKESTGKDQVKHIKIVTDPKGGIAIEVTRPVFETKTKTITVGEVTKTTTWTERKDVVEKFHAPDAATLKKDNPGAFKIYEKFGGNGGGVKIQQGAIRIEGGGKIRIVDDLFGEPEPAAAPPQSAPDP